MTHTAGLLLRLGLVTLFAAGLTAPAGAAIPPAAAAKLDPRLAAKAAAGAETSTAVWITFRDKGERDAADLDSKLERAEIALTPRARARRLRAHVRPLVDYRDLQVSPVYLDSLRRRELRPLAVSRWFNRAAVRVPASRLVELAAPEWVAHIAPVERAMRPRDWVEMAEWRPAVGPLAPRDAPRAEAPAVVDHGMTTGQLSQINVTALHDSGFTGAGVLICILDAGFNNHDLHEALRDRVFAPGFKRDFVEGDTVVTDSSSFNLSHGTWVMGLIAADKSGTYVGAAFGADYALARTEDGLSETPVEMLYWGMGAEWADSLGADLITSSVGYTTFDGGVGDYAYSDMDGHTTDVSRAAEIAASKGMLVVNSAGNMGQTSWHYVVAPADVDGDSLIAAGAVDSSGAVAGFSSYGPTYDGRIKPDLVARGVANPIVSAAIGSQGYGTSQGTSFSAPLIAGLAACLMQAHPEWTPVDVIQALRETASQTFTPDNRIGYGIPDGLAALQWPVGKTGAPLPPSEALGLRLLGANPARPGGVRARVEFALGDPRRTPATGRVRVFDIMGRPMRELWSGTLSYGRWVTASWDGRDGDGREVAPGIYWIAFEAAGRISTVRLVVLD